MEFIINMNVVKLKFNALAFTLAEVLIVLTIIGVVAMLIIPLIVNYYQDIACKSALTKVYSVLSQASSQIASNASKSIWTHDDNNEMKSFLVHICR